MTATTFLDAVLAVSVVEFTLLFITEDFVRRLNLLELLSITTSVGMVSSGKLEVGLLDRVEISLFVNSKNSVELGVVDLLRGTTAAWHAAHLFKIAEWESSHTASTSKEH